LTQTITSLECFGAPQHILAAFELLQFQTPSADRLDCLSEGERRRFLKWCDVRQLTFLLPEVCSSRLPPWVTQQVIPKRQRYEQRYKRLKQELFEIVEAFNAESLEFVMLKGLSHAPTFTPDALLRAQGDIDLWFSGPSVYKGQDVLRSLGYVPQLASTSRHLSPMARPSSWKWRGDVFDPQMPISVELHYELWSEEAECIPVSQLHRFWERKKIREFDGHKIHVLCEPDLLAFACLHFFLHLLHGDLPLQRAWEIARFLHTHVENEEFWASWRLSHPADLRIIETCVFSLVSKWFGCRVRRELVAGFQQLPAMAQSWLTDLSLDPLRSEWAPNKSELWLHWAFIPKRRYKARVLLRRLLPTSIPSFADRANSQSSLLSNLLMRVRQLRLLTSRLTRHFLTFFPTVLQGLRWFWLAKTHEG
jgi:hypothetical protein